MAERTISLFVVAVAIAYLMRQRGLDAFVLRSLGRMDDGTDGRSAP
jgi:hypothetical protein